MESRIEIRIGDKASFIKKIHEQDIRNFAEVSGDHNPVHLNEEYAQTTIFRKRIAHGFLVGSFISAAIGQKLPGEGTIYISQNLKFLAPVYIDDEIKAIIEVIGFPKPNRVLLKTICVNQYGVAVIEGEALVIPPKNVIIDIE